MAAPASPAPDKVRLPGEAEGHTVSPDAVRRKNLRDLAMLGLALVSVGMVTYDWFYRDQLRPDEVLAFELVDLAIVGVFAVEFAWRLNRAERKLGFVARNWFDLLGMVPMMATSLPLFRAFRLLRAGMIASRLLRMWAYFTGEQSAQVLFNRYRAALVEEVADRVMLQGIGMAEDIVARGTYLRAMSDGLAERREDLVRMAVESGKATDAGKWIALLPGSEAFLRNAAGTAVDTVVTALRSEEMQRTFETTVRKVTAELREEVARKAWREARGRPPGQPGTLPAAPAKAS